MVQFDINLWTQNPHHNVLLLHCSYQKEEKARPRNLLKKILFSLPFRMKFLTSPMTFPFNLLFYYPFLLSSVSCCTKHVATACRNLKTVSSNFSVDWFVLLSMCSSISIPIKLVLRHPRGAQPPHWTRVSCNLHWTRFPQNLVTDRTRDVSRPCMYSICCRNEVTSSSDGDADRYVIIIKLLEHISSAVLTMLRRWKTQPPIEEYCLQGCNTV